MPTHKRPTEHTAYSHEDEVTVGLRLGTTNLIPHSLPQTRFWRCVGLVKFFLFFRAAVKDTYVSRNRSRSLAVGVGKRGSHISDRGCRGGGGLVCICMSAVGHSMTCGMNRKCVEDTAFITWKLSAVKFRAHHPVSCLVGGSVRQRLSLGLRGGAEFVSRFEHRLHSEWGFLWFTSVSPGKRRSSAWNATTTASFHILYVLTDVTHCQLHRQFINHTPVNTKDCGRYK